MYKITHLPTASVYFGETIQPLRRRLNQHLNNPHWNMAKVLGDRAPASYSIAAHGTAGVPRVADTMERTLIMAARGPDMPRCLNVSNGPPYMDPRACYFKRAALARRRAMPQHC